MPKDEDESRPSPLHKPVRGFTKEARIAAQAAKAAKRADAEPFGTPEVFVVVTGARAFTWEMRRFGGLVLQRSGEAFPDAASAREAGEKALEVMLATSDLPTFKRTRHPE